MKLHPTRLAFLLATAALLGACAGDKPKANHRSARTDGQSAAGTQRETAQDADEPSDEPSGKKPSVGMSKAQIEKMYGEPSSRNHTARGETWTYWFNRGHALIPYNFGYKPRMGTFIFDESGRLRDYSWNE